MSYDFSYKGGVLKKSRHMNEKFLLFFIVGGREVPIYQMRENNLIWATKKPNAGATEQIVHEAFQRLSIRTASRYESCHDFSTSSNVIKVFLSQSGFGIASRFYSFYLKLGTGAGNVVTIVPFSGESHGFFFKATAKFLKKKEVMEVLSEDSESWHFLQKQQMLPLEILRSVVSIDRSFVKKGIRHVRLGRKKK